MLFDEDHSVSKGTRMPKFPSSPLIVLQSPCRFNGTRISGFKTF